MFLSLEAHNQIKSFSDGCARYMEPQQYIAHTFIEMPSNSQNGSAVGRSQPGFGGTTE
jgi:hypothetical protein